MPYRVETHEAETRRPAAGPGSTQALCESFLLSLWSKFGAWIGGSSYPDGKLPVSVTPWRLSRTGVALKQPWIGGPAIENSQKYSTLAMVGGVRRSV